MPPTVPTYNEYKPVRSYGWRPDLPDFRDQHFLPKNMAAPAPRKFSLRAQFPAAWNQLNLGSCTGNGNGAVLAHRLLQQNRLTMPVANTPAGVPSRLMIYWNERYLEQSINVDAGASIRDGIRSLARWGACFENIWPYDVTQFRVQPSKAAYRLALKDTIKQYLRVGTADHAAKKIAVFQGNPIVGGFTVYQSMESDQVGQSGMVPYPNLAEDPVGGHCVVKIGWDDDLVIGDKQGCWECRNSWGTAWGDQGNFFVPYAYFDSPQLSDDWWMVLRV